MRIRGIGTARRIAGWARSQLHRGPLILGYHQVAKSDWDPQHLCVAPENFAAQLEILTAKARPITLTQLVSAMREGRKLDRCFVVTLDDGYADTYTAAAPILERYAVPATAYITTGIIGEQFWWCEVEYLVARSTELPESIAVDIEGAHFGWRRTTDTRRERARLVQALGDQFRALPFSAQAEALRQVTTQFEPEVAGGSAIRALSVEQIASLARSELVEIGSHMVTHTSLNTLSLNAQRDELGKSKSKLEDMCGRPIVSCSYPNGRISADTPGIAAELGYSSACTSKEALVAMSGNPMTLPRLWVGDWDGDRFAQWLRWWLR